MTNVRFSITRETLTGREQVGGVIEARPSARRNLATEVVLPDAVRIVLTAGEDAPVVDLEPTTSQWVWRIIERVEKGAHGSRFLAVPDTEDTVEYVELVEVDPASLDPLPSVPSVADALEAEALAREAADAALADEVAAKADAAALADKADLVAGAVPDGQLPERLSDTSLNATIDAAVANGGSLIAYTSYAPESVTTVSTTSLLHEPVDATNLTITFTVPASGAVEVELESNTLVSSDAAMSWALLEDGVRVPGSTVAVAAITGSRVRTGMSVIIAGLTPGDVKTWVWAFNRATGTTANMTIGGTVSSAAGPATMRVRSVPLALAP